MRICTPGCCQHHPLPSRAQPPGCTPQLARQDPAEWGAGGAGDSRLQHRGICPPWTPAPLQLGVSTGLQGPAWTRRALLLGICSDVSVSGRGDCSLVRAGTAGSGINLGTSPLQVPHSATVPPPWPLILLSKLSHPQAGSSLHHQCLRALTHLHPSPSVLCCGAHSKSRPSSALCLPFCSRSSACVCC